jgi:predicted kinase
MSGPAEADAARDDGESSRFEGMEAVLLIGIQGSGKSTFFRERFFDTHVRISLDLLRTRHRERLLLRTCLRTQQRFAVDNTNVRAAERAVYITEARAASFLVVGYYFLPELAAALRRNDQRMGRERIPPKGVVGTYRRLEPPAMSEGFDALHTVWIDETGQFIVAP